MASGRLSKVKGKILDIPNPPTIGTATAGGESVSIAFTAYSGGAGGPTRSYIAKSNPGNITATGSTSPINVTGLTAGTSYTISVAGVNETGTGEYSSASGSAVPTELTSFESIATLTVGSGGASSVEFTSITSNFTHLQLRMYAVGTTDPTIQINSASNPTAAHRLRGDGSSAGAGADYANYFNYAQSLNATYPSIAILDFLDYKDTNKNRVLRYLYGIDKNGSGEIIFDSKLWATTNAISSIKISASLNQYSHFALYGIKGS